jgi:hypothetical protein
MKHVKLEIGKPLKLEVIWYDQVPVPPQERRLEGEVIGWRTSQILVRIPDYAVVRFWKHNGFEVGNPASERRGYRIDLEALAESVKPDPGVEVSLSAIDGALDAVAHDQVA